MPPFYDVYARIPAGNWADALAHFVDRYVAVEQPNEPRLPAVLRTYVESAPMDGDEGVLAELRPDPSTSHAFSIYLEAKSHAGASITITEESELVLGLSLDDPDNSAAVWEEGRRLLEDLMKEFRAIEGMTGVELPPPHSASAWDDALLSLTHVRYST